MGCADLKTVGITGVARAVLDKAVFVVYLVFFALALLYVFAYYTSSLHFAFLLKLKNVTVLPPLCM